MAMAAYGVVGVVVFALVCVWNIKVRKAEARRLAMLSAEDRARVLEGRRPRADTGWDVAVLH